MNRRNKSLENIRIYLIIGKTEDGKIKKKYYEEKNEKVLTCNCTCGRKN